MHFLQYVKSFYFSNAGFLAGGKQERVDEKVEQCFTFWKVACEVMEVITDKMFFVKTLMKDLHGRGIAFLQADHGNR